MSLYKLSRVAMYGGLFIGVTTLGTYAYASKGITMSPVYVEAARCASENAQLMHAMGDKVRFGSVAVFDKNTKLNNTEAKLVIPLEGTGDQEGNLTVLAHKGSASDKSWTFDSIVFQQTWPDDLRVDLITTSTVLPDPSKPRKPMKHKGVFTSTETKKE
eukprot:m.5935 g.5935  ORF g.5935 m.5935 type:complete len:159 (+) comp5107_c0_seq2:201-677(+)